MIQKQLLDDVRDSLLRDIQSARSDDQLDTVYIAWLTPEIGLSRNVPNVIDEITSAATRTYRQTAALALAAHTNGIDSDAASILRSDLEQLFGREPIVSGTPMPFCMDGLALTGIMLGTQVLQDDALTQGAANWLRRCCQVTSAGTGIGEWQEWLLRIVGAHTSISWSGQRNWGDTASIVSVALRSRGIVSRHDGGSEEEEEERALRAIQTPVAGESPFEYAVLRLAALAWIRRVRPVADLKAASIDDLANLLRRLPDGLMNWTWEQKPRTRAAVEARKWHVDNEYHVQNILWLLLAPVFPGLVTEDVTPKVGPLQPRADIGVPALRAVVEAKFMRSRDAPKEMIEQIAQDASLYLVPGSRYDQIIPFIWDDSRRSEHHEDILRGLRQIRGVADAIIISRPGDMSDGH